MLKFQYNDIAHLRKEMVTKIEFNAFKQYVEYRFNGLESRFNGLESRIESRIDGLESKISFLKWIVLFGFAIMTVGITVLAIMQVYVMSSIKKNK